MIFLGRLALCLALCLAWRPSPFSPPFTELTNAWSGPHNAPKDYGQDYSHSPFWVVDLGR
ncbi:MAG: hypothetical protein LBS60_05980 [Deltaproteobacteria bacterium]|nr:hypothetical protein [Deltaproteobacteria bacterium]